MSGYHKTNIQTSVHLEFCTNYEGGMISLWLYKENKLWDWENYSTYSPLSSIHLWLRCFNFEKNNVIFIFLVRVVALYSDRFMHYMAANKWKSDGNRSLFHKMNNCGRIATGWHLEKQFIGQQAKPFPCDCVRSCLHSTPCCESSRWNRNILPKWTFVLLRRENGYSREIIVPMAYLLSVP
jgi:hypothetical protein